MRLDTLRPATVQHLLSYSTLQEKKKEDPLFGRIGPRPDDKQSDFSVKTYAYLCYAGEVLSPLFKGPLLVSSAIGPIRRSLILLQETLKLEAEQIKPILIDQNQQSPYMFRNEQPIKPEQRMEIECSKPQPRPLSEKKMLVKYLPRWIEKAVKLLEFVEDAKASGVTPSPEFFLPRFWSEDTPRQEFISFCLKEAVAKPVFRQALERHICVGSLPDFFNPSSVELALAEAKLDRLHVELQMHNSQDPSLLGRLRDSLSGGSFKLDPKSWDTRLGEAAATIRAHIHRL
jgi:hypothetical protein